MWSSIIIVSCFGGGRAQGTFANTGQDGNVGAVKSARVLVPAVLFVVGVIVVLYGVLALTFNERGGSTYVTLAGHRLDPHRVGAVCLVLGLAAIAAAVGILRRGRTRS
jgi:hypothetical protein